MDAATKALVSARADRAGAAMNAHQGFNCVQHSLLMGFTHKRFSATSYILTWDLKYSFANLDPSMVWCAGD